MEISTGCRNDYLQIFDGSDDSAPLIGRFCGNEMPKKKFTSSANFISIVMVTNDKITSRGFIAQYKQVDAGSITDPTTPSNIFFHFFHVFKCFFESLIDSLEPVYIQIV